MIDVFFINSLEEKFLIDTINSFLLETKITNIEDNFVIKIVEDKKANRSTISAMNQIYKSSQLFYSLTSCFNSYFRVHIIICFLFFSSL